jgi:hypothetical protein
MEQYCRRQFDWLVSWLLAGLRTAHSRTPVACPGDCGTND